MTLTCSVKDPDGFRYDWYRETSHFPGKTPLQTDKGKESNRVISQGGKYTCRGRRRKLDVVTPESNAVFIEETGEFSIFQWNKQLTVFMFLNNAHSVEGK